MALLASLLLIVVLGLLIGIPVVLALRPIMRRCRKEAEEEREAAEVREAALRELRDEGIGLEAEEVDAEKQR